MPKKKKRRSPIERLLKDNKPKKPIKKEDDDEAPELPPKRKRLKPGPARFVAEYLKDKNATRAYIAAGYSPNGAGQAAHKLLKNADVKAAVDKGLARMDVRLNISAKRIKKRLAELAFNTPYIKTSDAIKCLELLGKTKAMFKDKVESEVKAQVSVVDPAEVKKTVEELEDEV